MAASGVEWSAADRRRPRGFGAALLRERNSRWSKLSPSSRAKIFAMIEIEAQLLNYTKEPAGRYEGCGVLSLGCAPSIPICKKTRPCVEKHPRHSWVPAVVCPQIGQRIVDGSAVRARPRASWRRGSSWLARASADRRLCYAQDLAALDAVPRLITAANVSIRPRFTPLSSFHILTYIRAESPSRQQQRIRFAIWPLDDGLASTIAPAVPHLRAQMNRPVIICGPIASILACLLSCRFSALSGHDQFMSTWSCSTHRNYRAAPARCVNAPRFMQPPITHR
jgi:hypothetical protein